MMHKMTMAACAGALAFAPAAATASNETTATADAVQAHVEAYRSGDIDRFVATFAEGATVVANGIVATGHAEIRAFYAANFAPGAPTIVVVERGKVEDRISLIVAYVLPDGSEMCCSYSEYTVKDGKITYLESNS